MWWWHGGGIHGGTVVARLETHWWHGERLCGIYILGGWRFMVVGGGLGGEWRVKV